MMSPVIRLKAPVSEIDLMAWVDVADPGARLAYHSGFLVIDTTGVVSKFSTDELSALRVTADAAYRLSELGRVHLVQERLGPDKFAYLAIARPWRGSLRTTAIEQLAAAA